MKKRYALVLLSVLILAGLLFYSDPQKVYGIFLLSDKSFLLYAFLISSAGVFLRVMKWKLLLKNASFFDVMPVQFLGSTISNFTPGKFGEPAKAVIMKAKTGIPVSRTLSSIIWERIMDILVLLLFSAVFIGRFSSGLFAAGVFSAFFFAGVLVFFFSVLYSKRFGMKVFGVLKKMPLADRISGEFIETFYREKINKKFLMMSFFITLFAWVTDGLVFYLSFRSVGIDLDPVFFVGLVSVSALIGIASFLPGGLGSTDVVMVLLLSAFMDGSLAVTGVFVARIMTFWYSSLLGWASFVYLGRNIELGKILD
ncbi:MAG: flippase-like domain-containing protein [Candidatus Aenigmarchaeota archaeon]|nr:flippase-like domain-containing protein [Candidatus Aenigmarchaeota archaeon]